MPILPFEAFDEGLWLLGGREVTPKGGARVFTGANPVRYKTVRSRNGNVSLAATAAISAARFYQNPVTLDNAGNVYFNFVSKLSGLTAGQRVSFTKAPPHVGSSAFLFGIGGGKAFKMDSTGAVTNWGIAAPADGATAAVATAPATVVINSFDATTGITAGLNTTLAIDTSVLGHVEGTGALQVDITKKKNGQFSQTVALNLNPSGSTDDDAIEFFLRIENTSYLKSIYLAFDLGTNYTTDFYHIALPVAAFTSNKNTLTSPNDVGGLDQAARNVGMLPPHALPAPNAPLLGTEFTSKLQQALRSLQFGGGIGVFGGINPPSPNFAPSKGALQALIDNGVTITPADGGWWFVRMPRRSFIRKGKNAGLTWANVSGYTFRILNNHSSDTLELRFDGFTFTGGTGMVGDFQYAYTFSNSRTGSYSQPNPTPVTISQIDRSGILLSGLPTTSTDAQVDTLTLWRSMGNGGIFYRLADIALSGFGGSFLDVTSDYIGFGPNPATLPAWVQNNPYTASTLIKPTSNNAGGYCFVATVGGTSNNVGQPTWPQLVGATVVDGTVTWQNVGKTLVLSVEMLLYVNQLPATTASQCAFWKGSMFVCADSAVGARGRIYYSSPGYAEGVAGYTDITNDDDPTVGFGIFNDNLFVFTQAGVWRVIDISVNAMLPAFTVVRVMGAPGCTSAQSIVSTPNVLIYQGPDGLYAFDGYFAERVAGQLLPLFRGDASEGYAAIGSIVAAAFGRDEYWFSDGSNGTFALNVMPGSLLGKGQGIVARSHGPSMTALHFERDTGKMLAGTLSNTLHLEEPGTFIDGVGTMSFDVQSAALYSGDKYIYKAQRVLFDVNPGGNTLSAIIIVDGTSTTLGTITGNARAKFEFTFNGSGSVISSRLTGNVTGGQLEVFRMAVEADLAGTNDQGSLGVQKGLKSAR